jgi:uncharacterized protein DUF3105
VSRGAIWLERLAIGVASLALSVGLIALLSGYFAGRDQAGIASSAGVPGQALRDQGNAILRPGQARPAYDSDPPTSGAHVRAPVRRDLAPLSDDQLLTALALGDVVIAYGGRTPPAGLMNVADQTASPFSATLAQAGQAVILTPRSGVSGLVALAWAHILQVSSPADPALRNFVAYWLGRGAP